MRTWVMVAIPLGLLLAAGTPGPRPPLRQRQLPAAVLDCQDVSRTIDQHLEARWEEEGITPSPQIDDLAFARRLWLDLLGTIPSLEELRELEQVPAAERKEWLIERAFQDRRFADTLAERLARVAVGGDVKADDLLYRRPRLVDWLARELDRNRTWDWLATELLTAAGRSVERPATNFVYAQDSDVVKLAARSTRAFLGIRIDCAQCHDHPFAEWEQRQFEGLAAYFVRTEQGFFGVRDTRTGEYELEVYDGDYPEEEDEQGPDEEALETDDPDSTKPRMRTVAPALPFRSELLTVTENDRRTRRQRLAAWITHAQNPYFARAIVNRMWSWYMGHGFCEPVDELDVSPIHEEELLDHLAQDLVEHGFQLKRTIRAIVSSEAYARSSAAAPEQDEREAVGLWATYDLKPLTARQLGESLLQATTLRAYDRERNITVRVIHYFQLNEWVKRHAEDPNSETQAPETLLQRLHVMNGEQFFDRTKFDSIFNPVVRLPGFSADDDTAVETAFLMFLTRYPSPAERAYFVDQLVNAQPPQGPARELAEQEQREHKAPENKNQARAQVMEDLFWTLANTTEFAWSH